MLPEIIFAITLLIIIKLITHLLSPKPPSHINVSRTVDFDELVNVAFEKEIAETINLEPVTIAIKNAIPAFEKFSQAVESMAIPFQTFAMTLDEVSAHLIEEYQKNKDIDRPPQPGLSTVEHQGNIYTWKLSQDKSCPECNQRNNQ
jgi:hypothetical protein